MKWIIIIGLLSLVFLIGCMTEDKVELAKEASAACKELGHNSSTDYLSAPGQSSYFLEKIECDENNVYRQSWEYCPECEKYDKWGRCQNWKNTCPKWVKER